MRHYLEYLLLRTIETMIRLIPKPLVEPVGGGMAWIIRRVLKYRWDIVLKNLSIAFPEKSEAERQRIAMASYKHFCVVILEFMKLAHWPVERIQPLVKLDNPELIKQCVEDELGAVLVSGHMGNWEAALALVATCHWDAAAMIQLRQSNRYVDEYSANLRRRRNFQILYPRGAVAEGVKLIESGIPFGLLCDQDGGKNGVFVPFFGKEASTPVGAAVLHLRSKGNLVFTFCARTGPFQYTWYFNLVAEHTGAPDTEDNVKKVTEQITKELEVAVRKYPEQYLWMHKRWKTEKGTQQ